MRLFVGKGLKYRRKDRPPPDWIKSSLSMHNGNCVEISGLADDLIRVRDSKHPHGAVLSFTPAEWDAFIGGVHLGEFNRKRRAR